MGKSKRGKKGSRISQQNQISEVEGTGGGSREDHQDSQVQEQDNSAPPTPRPLDETEQITKTTSSLQLAVKEPFPPLPEKITSEQPFKEPFATVKRSSKLNADAKAFYPSGSSQDGDSGQPKSHLNSEADEMEWRDDSPAGSRDRSLRQDRPHRNDARVGVNRQDGSENVRSYGNRTFHSSNRGNSQNNSSYRGNGSSRSSNRSDRDNNRSNRESNRIDTDNNSSYRGNTSSYRGNNRSNRDNNSSYRGNKSSSRRDSSYRDNTRSDRDNRSDTYNNSSYGDNNRSNRRDSNKFRRGSNSSHYQQFTGNRNDGKPSDNTQEHERPQEHGKPQEYGRPQQHGRPHEHVRPQEQAPQAGEWSEERGKPQNHERPQERERPQEQGPPASEWSQVHGRPQKHERRQEREWPQQHGKPQEYGRPQEHGKPEDHSRGGAIESIRPSGHDSQRTIPIRNYGNSSDNIQEHGKPDYRSQGGYSEDIRPSGHDSQYYVNREKRGNNTQERGKSGYRSKGGTRWSRESINSHYPPKVAMLDETWDVTPLSQGILQEREKEENWDEEPEVNSVTTTTSTHQNLSILQVSSCVADKTSNREESDRIDLFWQGQVEEEVPGYEEEEEGDEEGASITDSKDDRTSPNESTDRWRKPDNSQNYSSSNQKRRSDLNWRSKDSSGQSSRWSDVGPSKNFNQNFGRKSLGLDNYNVGESGDEDYDEFIRLYDKRSRYEGEMIKEIDQDLFEMGKEYSLAHCVAMDMRMGSGIAVTFKREFKQLDELLNQRQKQGGLALLDLSKGDTKRFIYYLVTKRESSGKPTYLTCWTSLKKMRDHIRTNEVKKLAIPRLACGLDRLEWHTVRAMLDYLFKGVDVEIIVCNFQQTDDIKSPARSNTCKIVEVPTALKDIEAMTVIIYFTTERGDETPLMKQLSEKFPFMQQFYRSKKVLGEVVRFDSKIGPYVLYGCIVRKRAGDPFDFVSFGKCLLHINKFNKKDDYSYVATQVIRDPHDDMLDKKIVTLMINWLRNVDVYICLNSESDVTETTGKLNVSVTGTNIK